MNARGLMELIILNIGLQKGIIQPALFSIMVMMAIVTTLMASPVFELVYRKSWPLSRKGTRPKQTPSSYRGSLLPGVILPDKILGRGSLGNYG
jgi:hypothetical protein